MALANDRPSVTRSTGRTRSPSVVELRKKARCASGSAAGGTSALTCVAGRPFFIKMGADQTSTAPAASRASNSGASSCGFMSSRFDSRIVSDGAAGASA